MKETLDAIERRLVRIERKINSFGELTCAAIALGAAAVAYKIVAQDLGLGGWLGGIAGFASFCAVGSWSMRDFLR